MNLDEFLYHYVEGYLFCDLQKMGDIKLIEDEDFGAAGYSMLTAVTAGMELLGWLARDSETKFEYRTWKSGQNFCYFWDNFFTEQNPEKYASKGKLIYELVRNGLAHSYIAKPGILVTKGHPEYHMNISTEPYQLTIDVQEFIGDFKKVYETPWKLNILDNKDDAELRLNSMISEYSEHSDEYFKAYFQKNPDKQQGIHTSTTNGSPAEYISDRCRAHISGVSASPIPLHCTPQSASPLIILKSKDKGRLSVF